MAVAVLPTCDPQPPSLTDQVPAWPPLGPCEHVVLGTVDNCSKCGDRCDWGLCAAGHCERLPEPFAENVKGDAMVVTDDGFVFQYGSYGRPNGLVRCSVDGVCENLSRGIRSQSTSAYWRGQYYAVLENGSVVAADETDGNAVVIARSTRAEKLGAENTLVVDDRDVYLMRSAGLCRVQDGRLDVLWKSEGRAWGIATDAVLDEEAVYLSVSAQRLPGVLGQMADDLAAVVAISRDSGELRGVASWPNIERIATDRLGRVYFADQHSVFCAGTSGGSPKRVFTQESGTISALGTVGVDVTVGIRGEAQDLYRLPGPLCLTETSKEQP
jgi:hypothetical protein